MGTAMEPAAGVATPDRLAMVAMRVALEAWGYGQPRRRDAVWAVVVNEHPLAHAGREAGVSRQRVHQWVQEFKAVAAHALTQAGVVAPGLPAMEETG